MVSRWSLIVPRAVSMAALSLNRRTTICWGWREDAGFLLYYFPTWAKARAMQHWIDRSGIAHRPMPTPVDGPQLGVGA